MSLPYQSAQSNVGNILHIYILRTLVIFCMVIFIILSVSVLYRLEIFVSKFNADILSQLYTSDTVNSKIEGKAMLRNRYNYPTPPIRDIKEKKHEITRSYWKHH